MWIYAAEIAIAFGELRDLLMFPRHSVNDGPPNDEIQDAPGR